MIFSPEILHIITASTFMFLLIIFFGSVVINKPEYNVYAYTAVITLFTASTIGMKVPIATIYDWGSGQLPFPLLNIILYVIFVYIFLWDVINTKLIKKHIFPFTTQYVLFILMFISYLIYGTLEDVPLKDVISRRGVINLVNMVVFIYCIKWSIRTKEQLQKLIDVLLVCASCMGVWGLFRLVFLDGDPANYYQNAENINVKLTYQDIGQSIIFCIVVAYTILKLQKTAVIKVTTKYLYYIICLISMANIVLSYRRTAWVGIFIIFIWLIILSDFKNKIKLASLLLIGGFIISSYVVSKRFNGDNLSSRKLTITGDFINKQGQLTIKAGRFAELADAYKNVQDNPLFGKGPWGTHGSVFMLGDMAYFTHSSIMHILLKLGVVGLILFLWIFVGYVLWWLKKRCQKWSDDQIKIIGEAAFCGFLFEIPDILFGTPIIIFRHLQIVGFIIAITYLAYYFGNTYTKDNHLHDQVRYKA